MKKILALVLAFCMMFHLTVLAEEDAQCGVIQPNFVTLKIPFPEELRENDSRHIVARYVDTKQVIPLSDAYGDHVYAMVPFENKQKAIEAFVPDSLSFSDNTGYDYEFYVMESLSRVGIITGNDKGEALPLANVTRAEATAMIMRFLGIAPDGDAKIPFSDVPSDSWFYQNVAALYQAGIVKGDSETTFSPKRNVTREEITVMIVRSLQYADLRCPARGEENISDKDSVSDWAKDAYEYIGVNYVSDYEGAGTSSPRRMLHPKKAATRFDIAYILENTLDNCQLYATDLAEAYFFDQKMPTIDGSGATYPFTEQIYRALFVNGATHPKYPKKHSESPVCYERLLNKEADILFVAVYPSKDVLSLAEEKGVELEIIPISEGVSSLSTNTYAVIRKDASQDSPAGRMAKFMLTEAGQSCVELAGFGRLY